MSFLYFFFFFFFFFQAEDGIRDTSVTGVQTCALPICFSKRSHDSSRRVPSSQALNRTLLEESWERFEKLTSLDTSLTIRSEERRVGKECKYRRSGDD